MSSTSNLIIQGGSVIPNFPQFGSNNNLSNFNSVNQSLIIQGGNLQTLQGSPLPKKFMSQGGKNYS